MNNTVTGDFIHLAILFFLTLITLELSSTDIIATIAVIGITGSILAGLLQATSVVAQKVS